MAAKDSTDLEAMHQPCLHPAGMIRLLRAIAKREEERKQPRKTWWERILDMWRSIK